MVSSAFTPRLVFALSVICMGIITFWGRTLRHDTGFIFGGNRISSRQGYQTRIKSLLTPISYEKRIWKHRVQILKEHCPSNISHLSIFKQSQGRTSIYQSSRANFTICKVPKSGSTFWATVYYILERGYDSKKLMQVRRDKIHSFGEQISITKRNESLKTFNILVARDPYTRLFSAYVDKIYLLGFPSAAKRTVKNKNEPLYRIGNGICGFNVSFENFLDFVTKKAFNGGDINPHWCPISLMCHACELDYHFVAKQQTLTRDTEHIINDILPLTREQKQNIKLIFSFKEAINKTMTGMLTTLLVQQETHTKICPDRDLFLKKLWKSLKIQGYIDKRVPFPDQELTTQTKREDVIRTVLETISRHPISASEKQRQRRDFLVQAYSNIKTSTLQNIMKVFQKDFELFGYDTKPPE